ncbi:MAG TPA: PQQ-binding-like beta-propeller repeat protein [Longilinea sp.]|nr:PQQ-binding-like beta-propeller repeat protein [Longilinea sp.]
MKLKLIIPITLVLLGLFLSACSGGPSYNAEPGIAADSHTAYVAYGSYMYAVNLDNGTQSWRYPDSSQNGESFFSSPLLVDNMAVLGSYNNILYGINLESHTTAWTFTNATGRYNASPIAAGDLILAANSDHNLYALDHSGGVQWWYTTGGALWATPAADDTRVYVPSMDHTLYAINLTSHQSDWTDDLGAALLGSPLLTQDGTLYIGTIAGELYKIKASDGSILTHTTLKAGLWATPVLDSGALYIGDQVGNVYSLSADDLSLNWTASLNTKTNNSVLASAAVLPDGVVFANDNGDVVEYSITGKEAWRQSLKGKLYADPVIAGDHLLIAIKDGDNLVQSFNLNGALGWFFKPPQ